MPNIERDLPVIAFESQEAWDAWLAAQPETSKGLWLKLAKKSSGIDGQKDKFDDRHWLTRFTPRRPKSKWSEINRTRAVLLIGQGKMKPVGMREIERAKKDGRWEAAYAPQSTIQIPDDLNAALLKNENAQIFFETLDNANRYAILFRVHEAKKADTRARQIEKFTSMLSRGETIHPQKDKP